MSFPSVQTQTQPARISETRRPPLFCDENRPIWEIVRRCMIALLHELDKAYGWDTFKK
jgi:hypothetical protein